MSERERKKIGHKLKEAREYLGISQSEAASAMNISRSAISLIESGQRKIDLIELKKFSKLFQRPISYFTDDKETKLPKVSELSGLQKATKGLSKNDVQEVLKFAEFLKSRSKRDTIDE